MKGLDYNFSDSAEKMMLSLPRGRKYCYLLAITLALAICGGVVISLLL